MQTLLELNTPASKLESMITVLNKYDRLDRKQSHNYDIDLEVNDDDDADDDDREDAEEKKEILSQQSLPEISTENDDELCVSCKTGEGLTRLIDIIQKRILIVSNRVTCAYRVLQGGQLYQVLVNGGICTIENMMVDKDDPQFIHLKCLFSKSDYGKFQAFYSGASKYQVSSGF